MNLANKITLSRILLIPFFFLFLTSIPQQVAQQVFEYALSPKQSLAIALFLFLLAALTDKLDGYIARKYQQITKLGKLLDPLADKLLISVAFIMLIALEQVAAWIVVIILGREMMVTYLRLVASAKGEVLAADKFGKLKMVLQVSAVALLLFQGLVANFFWLEFVTNSILWLTVLVTLYSGFNYLIMNKRVLIH